MEQRSVIETSCEDNAPNYSPPFGMAPETMTKKNTLWLPGCLKNRQLLRRLKSHTVPAAAAPSDREATLSAELQGGSRTKTHTCTHTVAQTNK